MTENYRYANNSATFGMASPTMAYKANSILKINGYQSNIVKLSNTANGCIYGVFVKKDSESAYALLQKSGISPTSIKR